ncbi:MAG TPA: hypothetical protein VF261_02485, partial [Candidatus Saccharimonadales bacterium]
SRSRIVNLTWEPEYDFSDLLLRIGGTGAPRIMYAGHFRDLDTKENVFLYLRLPKGLPLNRTMSDANVLAITLRDSPYASVFVNCRPDIGASLTNWFKNTIRPRNSQKL